MPINVDKEKSDLIKINIELFHKSSVVEVQQYSPRCYQPTVGLTVVPSLK